MCNFVRLDIDVCQTWSLLVSCSYSIAGLNTECNISMYFSASGASLLRSTSEMWRRRHALSSHALQCNSKHCIVMHIMHIPHPNIALQCILCISFIQTLNCNAHYAYTSYKHMMAVLLTKNLLIVSPIGDEDPGLMKNDLNEDFSNFSFHV